MNTSLKINRHPFDLILYIYLFLIFLRPHPDFIPSFYSVYICDIINLSLIFIYFTMKRKINYNIKNIIIISFFFLILLFIPTTFNYSKDAIINFFRLIYYCISLIFLVDIFQNSSMDITKFIKLNHFIFYIIFLIGLIQLINFPILGVVVFNLFGTDKLRTIWSGYPRIFSTFYNANWFGVYLIFYISILLSLYEFKKINTKSFLVKLFLSSLLLAFSGSRTALVGVTIVLLAYFISNFNFKKIFLVFGISFIIFITFNLLNNYIELFSRTFNRFKEIFNILKEFDKSLILKNLDVLTGGRYKHWTNYWDTYLSRPITGFGDNLGIPHNSYLTILMNWGFFGGLLFFPLILLFYFRVSLDIIIKKKFSNKLSLYFFSGFFTVSFAADFILTSQVFLIFLIVLALLIISFNKINGSKLNEI